MTLKYFLKARSAREEGVGMAKHEDAQENAKKILNIYKHFDSKEGDVLRANNFMAVGSSKGWNMRDLQQGLDFAVEKHWLKMEPTGWLKLTESGFEEMRRALIH